jgi:hypothetical protein
MAVMINKRSDQNLKGVYASASQGIPVSKLMPAELTDCG